ncbi:unnamed protein product [Notodromas monacha]|uniref:RRM domain-containing protein n=1 Tax=Notodromas monacha TaxID=399045 RepID=A0A7R9BRH3_9CRUS|nr:unnamed protein product [Notodromas monacha]CAG0920358.1 unnamed protein product [Notodromas monacha]
MSSNSKRGPNRNARVSIDVEISDLSAVVVHNLEYAVDKVLLGELFSQAGPVVDVSLFDEEDGKVALVYFPAEESSLYAIHLMQGIKLFHRPLYCELLVLDTTQIQAQNQGASQNRTPNNHPKRNPWRNNDEKSTAGRQFRGSEGPSGISPVSMPYSSRPQPQYGFMHSYENPGYPPPQPMMYPCNDNHGSYGKQHSSTPTQHYRRRR